MRKCIFFLLYFILTVTLEVEAQSKADSLSGEYYLRGIKETASGFKLVDDSVFQFFFSYGALDRYGKGKWSYQKGKIMLNSLPGERSAFSLLNSSRRPGDSIIIQIKADNIFFLSRCLGIIRSGNKSMELMSNREGFIKFPAQKIDTIELFFEFCPEKQSIFVPGNPEDNYFLFGFAPTIMEVFFDKFILYPAKSKLSGGHPLLRGGNYDYIRVE